MKRTLIAIAATMLVAGVASAASFTIDADGASYSPSGTVTIDVTVDVGAEVVPPFNQYFIQVGWDTNVVSGPSNSSQNPVLAGLSGSTTPTCAVTGDVCTVITQVNAGFSNVNVGPATITGQLLLTVLPGATSGQLLGLTISAYNNLGDTNPDDVLVGANFANAVVPEPTTAALLGLGLLGLGVAGRRR